jgi:hypothetical protein
MGLGREERGAQVVPELGKRPGRATGAGGAGAPWPGHVERKGERWCKGTMARPQGRRKKKEGWCPLGFIRKGRKRGSVG